MDSGFHVDHRDMRAIESIARPDLIPFRCERGLPLTIPHRATDLGPPAAPCPTPGAAWLEPGGARSKPVNLA